MINETEQPAPLWPLVNQLPLPGPDPFSTEQEALEPGMTRVWLMALLCQALSLMPYVSHM